MMTAKEHVITATCAFVLVALASAVLYAVFSHMDRQHEEEVRNRKPVPDAAMASKVAQCKSVGLAVDFDVFSPGDRRVRKVWCTPPKQIDVSNVEAR